MKLIGKVLWWDRRDKNGIIVDAFGNEYYFDISVIDGRHESGLKTGAVVQFKKNESIAKISCATSVYLPPRKSKERFEREFERSLQLTLPL